MNGGYEREREIEGGREDEGEGEREILGREVRGDLSNKLTLKQ